MAKKNTIAFKMPFETLSGKLATKQKGIAYSGQIGDAPYFSPDGKRSATNFEKYIVSAKRRGRNFFYVKSRQVMNLSRSQRVSQLLAAMANELTNWLLLNIGIANQLKTLYNSDKRGFYTIGDYLRSELISSLRVGGTSLVIYARDEYDVAVRTFSLGDNPLNMDTVQCVVGGQKSLPERVSAISQKFFAAYYPTQLIDGRMFLPVVRNSKIYRLPIGLGSASLDSSFTMGDLISDYGESQEIENSLLIHNLGNIRSENNEVQVRIYDSESGKYVGGGEFFTLYADEEKTQPVTEEDQLAQMATYYV